MLQSSVVKELLSKYFFVLDFHLSVQWYLSRQVINFIIFRCQLSRYYDTYLPFLLEACNDETPDVRQVSISHSLLLYIVNTIFIV